MIDFLEYFYEHGSDLNWVAFTNDLSYKYFNLLFSPNRRLGITKDRMFMYTPVIYFHKPSVLKDPFNRQLEKYHEAGLIEFWVRKYIDDRKIKTTKIPSILQMGSLMIFFQIIIIMYVISFIIFVSEVISVRFRRVKCFLDYLTY